MQKFPSMPLGLLDYCVEENKHSCASAVRAYPWLGVCDSDEADKDRKWLRFGGGGGGGGGEAEPDRKLPAPGCWGEGQREGAYFGSNIRENSLESLEIATCCHLGEQVSRSEAWAAQQQSAWWILRLDQQLAAAASPESGHFSLIRGRFQFVEKQNDWVWLWVSTESNFKRHSPQDSAWPGSVSSCPVCPPFI